MRAGGAAWFALSTLLAACGSALPVHGEPGDEAPWVGQPWPEELDFGGSIPEGMEAVWSEPTAEAIAGYPSGWPDFAGILFQVRVWEGEQLSHDFTLAVRLDSLPMRTSNVTLRINIAGTVERLVSDSALVSTEVSGAGIAPVDGPLPLLPLPKDFMAVGFVEACRAMPADTGAGFPEAARKSVGALLCLLKLVQEQAPLRSVLIELVDAPSLWSLVTHLGVEINVGADFQDAWQPSGAPAATVGPGPVWAFPVNLSANGQPALEMLWFAVEPKGPLMLSGGVIGILGRDPSDPSRRLAVSWLGANELMSTPSLDRFIQEQS